MLLHSTRRQPTRRKWWTKCSSPTDELLLTRVGVESRAQGRRAVPHRHARHCWSLSCLHCRLDGGQSMPFFSYIVRIRWETHPDWSLSWLVPYCLDIPSNLIGFEVVGMFLFWNIAKQCARCAMFAASKLRRTSFMNLWQIVCKTPVYKHCYKHEFYAYKAPEVGANVLFIICCPWNRPGRWTASNQNERLARRPGNLKEWQPLLRKWLITVQQRYKNVPKQPPYEYRHSALSRLRELCFIE